MVLFVSKGSLYSEPFVFWRDQTSINMKQFIFICLLFATFQSINGQNLAPVISGFNVSVDAPNSSASLFYILNDAENDPLEVIVQFSKDGGKTYTTLESPDISGDIGFPVSSGIRTATCQNLVHSFPARRSSDLGQMAAQGSGVMDIRGIPHQLGRDDSRS